MAVKVTRPITKAGRYYKAGEVIADPSSVELSLARLYGWTKVEGGGQATAPAAPPKKKAKPRQPRAAKVNDE